MKFSESVLKWKNYIEETYDAVVEQPWAKYPENITFKEKLSGKWFGLIMPVAARKLGMDSDEILEVINVKAETEFISMVTQSEGYFPGYHMNKQHWLTILLDGSVPDEQVKQCIETSYEMITDTPTRRIYEAVKRIPKGHVATYGQVAALAGNPKMSRAVGNALHKNPDPENIPCFRVVNSKGELAGGFAFGGMEVQAELLCCDGTEVTDGVVDLAKYGIELLENEDGFFVKGEQSWER